MEHQGIKIEFLGLIELYYDRGNHHEFLSLVSDRIGPVSRPVEYPAVRISGPIWLYPNILSAEETIEKINIRKKEMKGGKVC